MTRDPRHPMTSELINDDAIAQLVRDTAAGWTMPAVRLDSPSWRDRIKGPRARRLAAAWRGVVVVDPADARRERHQDRLGPARGLEPEGRIGRIERPSLQ